MPDGHPIRAISILAERSCLTVTGAVVPRPIRHLVALVLAGLVLAASAVPVLAADEPVLTGTVLDASGAPFPVEQARMTMTGPDGGGMHAAPLEIAPDGSFEVALQPWGSATSPAEVTISITGVVAESIANADGCTDDYAPVAKATFDVALESGGEPEPVAIVALPSIVGTVCGAAATSAPTLPPSAVSPVTPAPSAAPAAAPVADSGETTSWLPILLLAVVGLALALGAWRVLSGRSRA
jgi:hypothetical protein